MDDKFMNQINEIENNRKNKRLIIFIVIVFLIFILIILYTFFNDKEYVTSVDALEERGLKVLYSIGNKTSWYDNKGYCYLENTSNREECKRINPNLLNSLDMYESKISITDNKYAIQFDYTDNDHIKFISLNDNDYLEFYLYSGCVVVFINNSCYSAVEGSYYNNVLVECDNYYKSRINDFYFNYLKFVKDYHIDIKTLPKMFNSFVIDTISDKVEELKSNNSTLSNDDIKKILDNNGNVTTNKEGNTINIIIEKENGKTVITSEFNENNEVVLFSFLLDNEIYTNKKYTYDISNNAEYLNYSSNSVCKLYMDIYYESKGITPNAIGCTEDERKDLEVYSSLVVDDIFNSYNLTVEELINYMKYYYDNN